MTRHAIRTIRRTSVALILLVLLLAGSLPIEAGPTTLPPPVVERTLNRQEITWNGGAGDGLWSNPGNWAGGDIPGPDDTARLVGLTSDARVDAAFAGAVGGLVLEADYAGTLVLERALRVRGDLEVAGGALHGGAAGLDVDGAVRVRGGLLVTPAGAAMNAVTLDIAAPGVVRLGAHGKLNLSGGGRPLTGDGLLDTMTHRPNSVEYTGAATAGLGDDGPLAGLRAAQPEGFARVGVLTLDPGEDFLGSAVIDPAGAYAYFGDWIDVGHVYKVDLATFTRVGVLTLPVGEERPLSAVIDPAGAYAYFGTYRTFPARVVKVDLATFTRVDALEMEADEDSICSALIDPAGAYAYFGTFYPGRVVKIDLAGFTRTDALTLSVGEEALWTALIDPAGDYAYFGADTAPGIVVKVDLDPFTRTAALTLDPAESNPRSAVMDPTGAYAYFGTNTEPGMVVQVDLAAFTRTAALTLNAGENYLGAAVIDPAGAYAYFGALQLWVGGYVVQVDLADFTRAGALTFDTSESSFTDAAIDPAGQYAYFAAFTVPGRVVKIELGAAGGTWKLYLPVIMRND